MNHHGHVVDQSIIVRHGDLTRRSECLGQSYGTHVSDPTVRIELTSQVYKTRALPLSYAGICFLVSPSLSVPPDQLLVTYRLQGSNLGIAFANACLTDKYNYQQLPNRIERGVRRGANFNDDQPSTSSTP
jgi:hypothetical protein